MATNPGGPNERAANRPLAAELPRCRATGRQNPPDVSLERRHPSTHTPRTANILLLALFAIFLLIACGSEETGAGPTEDPDEPRPGAEATRQQEPRTGTATATPAPARARATPQASRPSATDPPATPSTGSTSAVAAPTPGPTPGTAPAVRPTLIPPSQTSQETDLAVLRGLLDYIPNLADVTNWFDDGTSINRFTGVEVVRGGRVVGLTLPPGTDGQISPEIGSLDRLEALDLGRATITGELPPELGQLRNLRLLRIIGEPPGDAGLTGGIPPELGNLTSLEELDLSANQLTGGIPPELGNLANLKRLSLAGNRLTGEIPQELGELPELEHLFLMSVSNRYIEATNQLSGCVPRNFLNRSRFSLAAGNLPFCPLPAASMSPKTDREALLVFYEAMGRPRDQLLNWGSDAPLSRWAGVTTNAEGRVTELRLGGMGIEGNLPPVLGDLSELQALVLGNKIHTPNRSENVWISQIPPELGYLSELEELDLDYSRSLAGEIPRELGKLLKLDKLLLAGNELEGEIPSELGNLSRLEHLTLAGNLFTGELPPELGKLANLTLLTLSGQYLTGCVPDSLRNALQVQGSSLGSLQFCQEQAAADRDAEDLARSTREALVALHHATGGPDWTESDGWLSESPVGEWFGVTVDRDGQVTGIRLFWNNLRGQLPPGLGDVTTLRELYLYGNELTGGVPAELGSLTSLRELYINQNQLSGCVPSSLREQLDMDNSDLGGLPFC